MMHASAVARAELQKRKVRLIKAMGMMGVDIDELSEKQLVEKVNMALGLMEVAEESKPREVKVVGVNKDKGEGGVMYELNTGEAVRWLKDNIVMTVMIE